MEVREGYRQTEVGVLPEDWSLESGCNIGSILTGPFGTLLKASEYTKGEGVPLISVGEIRKGFLKITEHTPRVPKQVVKRLPQYVLRQGDIVFGRKGGVDRSSIIREADAGCFLGSDGMAIRSDNQHAEYLAAQFQRGTTMASLNQEILRRVVIPLPPTLAEQEAIAEALSDADAWIASLEHLIAKKRQIKQGAMQELLTGKRRLPGFETQSGTQQTEVGFRGIGKSSPWVIWHRSHEGLLRGL